MNKEVLPLNIYPDNGSKFAGFHREILRWNQSLEQDKLADDTSKLRIQWCYNNNIINNNNIYFSTCESDAQYKIKIVQIRHGADNKNRNLTYNAMCFRSQSHKRQYDLLSTRFPILNQG